MGAGESIEIPPVETLMAKYAPVSQMHAEKERKYRAEYEANSHKHNVKALAKKFDEFLQQPCGCILVDLQGNESKQKIIKELRSAKYEVSAEYPYVKICLPGAEQNRGPEAERLR